MFCLAMKRRRLLANIFIKDKCIENNYIYTVEKLLLVKSCNRKMFNINLQPNRRMVNILKILIMHTYPLLYYALEYQLTSTAIGHVSCILPRMFGICDCVFGALHPILFFSIAPGIKVIAFLLRACIYCM